VSDIGLLPEPRPPAAEDSFPLFAPGSTLDDQFVARLLERPVGSEPARLLDFALVEVGGLPGFSIVAVPGREVEGRLFRGLEGEDYRRLDAYQGLGEGLYRRVAARVVATSRGQAESEPANVYVPTEKTLARRGRR
jgi:hypothetical protein